MNDTTSTTPEVYAEPTAERKAARLASHHLDVYAALDNIGEIHTRIVNLLSGRDFTVVRRYADQRSVPTVTTGCYLDTGWRDDPVNRWKNDGDASGGVGIHYKPGLGAVGIQAEYATEREARAAAHDGSHHRFQRREVVHVSFVGGHTPTDVGQTSCISITRTNENGVTEEIVLAPRVVSSKDAADAEGALLDRVAGHITATGEPLTAEAAAALAAHVRYGWESGLRA